MMDGSTFTPGLGPPESSEPESLLKVVDVSYGCQIWVFPKIVGFPQIGW